MNENYTCTEIIPRLWIGDLNDAEITEKEHDFERVINCLNIVEPINGYVDVRVLEALTIIIDKAINSKKERVLVHCGGGIERSPLVVAWYLSKTQYITLDEAYEIIIKKRPYVQNRSDWTPWELRNQKGLI